MAFNGSVVAVVLAALLVAFASPSAALLLLLLALGVYVYLATNRPKTGAGGKKKRPKAEAGSKKPPPATTRRVPQEPRRVTAHDLAAVAKSGLDAVELEALVAQAVTLGLDLFHHAAAVGDRDLFSTMMAFLPIRVFAREMRRRNATGMTPLECCAHMHPTLATAVQTFCVERGVDLQEPQSDHPRQKRVAGPTAVKLKDIVGMEQPRRRIAQALRLAEKATDRQTLNLRPLLLEGPPGTGKSFLAMCVAAEMDREVVEIKCQDVLSRHLGGTEAQVRAHFERAARMTPTKGLVLINEFESLCPRLKEGSESWHATLRQCFLTLFDDSRDPTSRFFGVFVVATTNYVANVDSAARDRMEAIHVSLPSFDDIKVLLPKLCAERVPELDVQHVDWGSVATSAHQHGLSARGLQDVATAVGRSCLSSAPGSQPRTATASDFDAAIYERSGDVPLEPLQRADKFIRVDIPPEIVCDRKLDADAVPLKTCLARCGWRFASAPSSVFRQIFALSNAITADSNLILRDVQSDRVFAGRGCYRVLSTLPRDPSALKPFDKYEVRTVYVQCTSGDGVKPIPLVTTSVFLESYAQSGVKKLEWEALDSNTVLYSPLASAMTVSAFLAPLMKPFATNCVFIESKATFHIDRTAEPASLLVLTTEQKAYKYLLGSDAVLVVGSESSPSSLNAIGYRVFVTASSSAQVVPANASVIYRAPGSSPPKGNPRSAPSSRGDAANLNRIEVAASKFVVCPNAATTIGATLRANGIYYAALDAVYVRQIDFDRCATWRVHEAQLLAVPVAESPPTYVCSGRGIADYAREESFRTKFHVYVPCSGSDQVLAPGMAVMLDLEVRCFCKLSQALSATRKFAILRYYPSQGQLNLDTQTHHGACISASGAQVRDKGYRDNDFLTGFRRGWYEDVYWRTVGDGPDRFLSGGVEGNNYKFNVRKEHDFGHDDKRIMIKLPNEGVVFCRGVGMNWDNPLMACVLFDQDGRVQDNYHYKGRLGRWNDIVQ
ncbi:hypothetical protein BBJ28_00023295 [Nothophytophthora sp. Chile5]|nr:hypothetical protein BBJ28_00023295 [Nothophytophthora sp. Chile5]